MDCKEIRVDMRKMTDGDRERQARERRLLFRLNHTEPMTEEYGAVLRELFGDRLGEGTYVAAPLAGAALDQVRLGRNVFINTNALLMARGGITIEDNVMIAANAQIISNNHDPYDLQVLTCRPVLIKKGAWIGAGATVLPGVRVGTHAVVGARSVVTRDIPDYAVAVGSPARVIKDLDADRFQDE
ncbi:MAG: acyltransferase [Anaerovoracaceae bacterium]|jgi:acetyltransferase-like isoleucine patch superfamily enzyme